ncbi:uncharacterized protein LOC142586366 [Dermacentor variabilis]|uniref:uncharacterized protein LOC142586366 n=1 Tax=Dermacentor variabilis TaxID=34621 RepID=UPI003F5CB6F6
MADKTGKLFVWQWNCASLKRRKASLQQFVKEQADKPHVLLLQETLCEEATFSGYRVVSTKGDGRRGVITMFKKAISFKEHEITIGRADASTTLEAQLVEIIPSGRIKQSIFVLNVYSPPTDQRQSFRGLLGRAVAIAGDSPLIVAGDFNAPHVAWGYNRQTAKGVNLVNTAEDRALTLVADPRFPTRIGTSVSRDTMPDLAFVRNTDAAWTNLQENLGSDHHIVALSIRIRAAPLRIFKYVDWDLLQKIRDEDESEYGALEDLLAQVKRDVERATKEISTDLKTPRMDARLAHLLEAKRSVLERWKTQRLNRRLRKKIAELNRSIEAHCLELNRQQWNEACSAADGRMRTGGKWNLLKHLLDDKQTKGNQRLSVHRLVHKQKQEGHSDTSLLRDLARKYLPVGKDELRECPQYVGEDAPKLDDPFSEADIREVLYNLNGRSAPGPGGITNRVLRNLDDRSISTIGKEINKVWEEGSVPDS